MTEVLRLAPILRWAGGKQQLTSHIVRFLPKDLAGRTYREPFFGAGSIFFALVPDKAVLSDSNEHLIHCYEAVRDNSTLVSVYLRALAKRASERHYYATRRRYNSAAHSVSQAARFIYLNKSCFNGIFRVNKNGKFNVPYGWKKPPALPTPFELRAVAGALGRARLFVGDFAEAMDDASTGDVLYLDPPYPPLNGIANFRHYTALRFSDADQKRLASLCRDLDRRGCFWVMSNADIPEIRRLYRGFRIRSLPVTRFVSCKSHKLIVRELIISNCT